LFVEYRAFVGLHIQCVVFCLCSYVVLSTRTTACVDKCSSGLGASSTNNSCQITYQVYDYYSIEKRIL